jgi:hypothetical protein
MNILNFNKFFEGALNIGEILKDIKGTSLYRGDTLVNKIRSQHVLEIEPSRNKGDRFVVKRMLDLTSSPPTYVDVIGATSSPIDQITGNDGKFDPSKARGYFLKGRNYQPVFQDSNNKVYTLTDLFKSVDFGSSGAGKLTNENEIIQMMLLAKRIETNRDFTMRKVYQLLELFEAGTIPTNVEVPAGFRVRNLEHFDLDPQWMATFKNSINNLAKSVFPAPNGSPLFKPEISYKFYQNGVLNPNSIHKIVSKKFRELLKASYHDDEEYKNLDFNKYCPADVWAITSDATIYIEICNKIKRAVDIENLSDILNEEFDKRTLIPISLKKVGIKVNSGKIIINNQLGAELPKFNVTQFHLEPNTEKGIGSKIDTTSIWIPKGETKPVERQRNIKIDTSNSRKFQNVDGEIDGVYARHGKISFLMMRKFIKESPLYDKVLQEDPDPLQSVDSLKEKTVEQLKDIVTDLNNDITRFNHDLSVKISYDLNGRPNESLEKKLISKIQSMQIIRALTIIDYYDVVINKTPRFKDLVPNSDNEVDRIITKVLLYALSINTGKFSTPRYARVI